MKCDETLYEAREVHTFREVVDSSAALFSQDPAFRLKDENGEYYDVTYEQFRNDVYALGSAIDNSGFENGKIAVIGHNSYHWALSYLAAVCSGNVAVPLDKDLSFDDLDNFLNAAQCGLVFADDAAMQKFISGKDRLRKDIVFVNTDSHTDDENAYSFDTYMSTGRKCAEEKNDAYKKFEGTKTDPDALSILIFTSGTTGSSKGVMLSQNNVCSDIVANSKVCDFHPGDRMLSVLPLHHTYECSLGFMEVIYNGCCISYCEGLMHLMKNMQEVQPTVFVTVPLMMEKIHGRIMKSIGEKKGGRFALAMGKFLAGAGNAVGISANDKIFNEILRNFGGHLRLVIMGAAPCNAEVVDDFKTFGVKIYLGYGLTECAPLVAGNNDGLCTSDSVGNPLPGIYVKIKDPDETGAGEILVKGPNVMLGYYNDPEATAAVFEDGWFRTGDLGTFDEQTNIVRIKGRLKNVIVTKNGKNIYPEELEYHLNNSPYIAESLVTGVAADSIEGDLDDIVVQANIFPDMKAIKEKLKKAEVSVEEATKVVTDSIKDINKKLPNYKKISKVDMRDSEFVKTTTAKIKRYIYENKENKENKNDDQTSGDKKE
jgi:long-chain acyl-CoA synthetase